MVDKNGVRKPESETKSISMGLDAAFICMNDLYSYSLLLEKKEKINEKK